MQENSVYEREIDLVQMIKYLIKRIPMMIGGAVIGLVLFLLLGIVMNSGEEIMEEGELTSFEKEYKEYEEDYAQLELEIADLKRSIEEQTSYNNESILMKINPYNKKSVSGQFYIDSDYQINPELTYQNIDITTSVAKAYQALATTGALANYINASLENPIRERYLNELVSIEYLGDATLQVTVMHTNQEEAQCIYDLTLKCMEENKAEFKKTIGDYKITLLNESDKASVDTALSELQTNNLDRINILKETLTEKENSFESLVEPVEAGISLKLPVIGAFLGSICVLGVYVVLFLINTTMKCAQDVIEVLNLPVLGTVSVMEGRKAEVKKSKRNKKKRYNQYGES
ncbi:MAG: hypothetical protein K2M46_00570 [Lachnospiraceae bacterium]|nr:hypothetical protein [Lachnospiraceae bacterium]